MCTPARDAVGSHPTGALRQQRGQGGQRTVIGDDDQHPFGGQDRNPLMCSSAVGGVEGDRGADDDHRVADGVDLGCLARADDVVDREPVQTQQVGRAAIAAASLRQAPPGLMSGSSASSSAIRSADRSVATVRSPLQTATGRGSVGSRAW